MTNCDHHFGTFTIFEFYLFLVIISAFRQRQAAFELHHKDAPPPRQQTRAIKARRVCSLGWLTQAGTNCAGNSYYAIMTA